MKTLSLILTTLALTLNAQAKTIPQGFTDEKVNLGDITYHVYKGGSGEPLIFLHGYAESALMWAPAMKAFKDKFTIYVPDIRGAGETDAPADGYDKVTMAKDIKRLMDHYQIKKARVVGHDIGLMVAYSLAAQFPESVEKLVVMDAFLPGVGPGDQIYNSPSIWHFRFNGEAPEALVKGREMIYFNSLWNGFSANPKSFPESDKKYYVSQYSRPGRMKAGFAYFKAFPKDAEDNKRLSQKKLPMPVLVIGGEKAMGNPLAATMKVVSDQLTVKVIANTGHWLLEENAKETLEALKNFL